MQTVKQPKSKSPKPSGTEVDSYADGQCVLRQKRIWDCLFAVSNPNFYFRKEIEHTNSLVVFGTMLDPKSIYGGIRKQRYRNAKLHLLLRVFSFVEEEVQQHGHRRHCMK